MRVTITIVLDHHIAFLSPSVVLILYTTISFLAEIFKSTYNLNSPLLHFIHIHYSCMSEFAELTFFAEV